MNYFPEEETQLSKAFELDIWSDFQEDDDTLVSTEQAQKFELLSAYIDGEVTPDERRQVQQWLDTDTDFKKLYLSLTRLEQNLQQAPVPSSNVSVEKITEGVFKKIEAQRNRRLVLAGSAILTMLVVGFASYFLPGRNSPVTQIAMNPRTPENESLMIGINQPIIEIPDTERK
ncbi:MAG: hypothetical protein N5P05_001296 [Chroococcopsis gigantea SAG 12.99]|jgi:anti-sigma factor RsiW|nr:zf-HC2 domain-containing protein [Chlorogloea purpurea SAG 13.99]MDV2999690.1 hypothetical protein [Chroococcopsis gigantea SAG 12.99]